MKAYQYLNLLLLACLSLAVQADEEHSYPYNKNLRSDANPVYVEECGACHFPYQAGLLPAASWQALMDTLADHFGENAELDQTLQHTLTHYLKRNAGDAKPNHLYAELKGYRRNAQTILRISQLPGFLHEHEEIPARVLQNNEPLSSFSQCDQCHTDASSGTYAEQRINIPGFGPWDD